MHWWRRVGKAAVLFAAMHFGAVGIDLTYARLCLPTTLSGMLVHTLLSGSDVCSALRTTANFAHTSASSWAYVAIATFLSYE
jgi:hypothetical protein